VPHLVSAKPEDDLPGDGWTVCTPQTAVGAFTAVGFYFAREVSAPVAVRYGYAANPEAANLYSKDGLPVGPFRTDNW
jgi:hypothetical protein